MGHPHVIRCRRRWLVVDAPAPLIDKRPGPPAQGRAFYFELAASSLLSEPVRGLARHHLSDPVRSAIIPIDYSLVAPYS
jgi:hypothetical protein